MTGNNRVRKPVAGSWAHRPFPRERLLAHSCHTDTRQSLVATVTLPFITLFKFPPFFLYFLLKYESNDPFIRSVFIPLLLSVPGYGRPYSPHTLLKLDIGDGTCTTSGDGTLHSISHDPSQGLQLSRPLGSPSSSHSCMQLTRTELAPACIFLFLGIPCHVNIPIVSVS